MSRTAGEDLKGALTLKLLAVSMHPAAQFARRALGAGAIGYLTKDSSSEAFVKAIEDARRGRHYLGRDAGDVLLNWTTKSKATPHDLLSDRKYQVRRLMGSGQTPSDITRDLGLSIKTVSTYRVGSSASLVCVPLRSECAMRSRINWSSPKIPELLDGLIDGVSTLFVSASRYPDVLQPANLVLVFKRAAALPTNKII